MQKTLLKYYKRLFDHMGPQRWWPGRTRFEIVVGAILTQNTNWGNVERAIKNLKKAKALTPARMSALAETELAKLIRPSGYFNVKAKRLGAFLDHLNTVHHGRLDSLFKTKRTALRTELLSINGIGPETADSIMLYAAGKPVFVVDAYTKRLVTRHGLIEDDPTYDEMQALFTGALPEDAALFNEYHALIVMTGKDYCRPKEPRCAECPHFVVCRVILM